MRLGFFYAVYAGNLILFALLGAYERVRVAAFRTSTESFDSPSRWTRWATRYLFFQFWLLNVSMVSILYLRPLVAALESIGVPGRLGFGIYLLTCIPTAALCFRWDLRYSRRADARKTAGREAQRNRWLDH